MHLERSHEANSADVSAARLYVLLGNCLRGQLRDVSANYLSTKLLLDTPIPTHTMLRIGRYDIEKMYDLQDLAQSYAVSTS
jgi:hypothetical protein